MNHVKLVARHDTWFKEGTEVYDYDAHYFEQKRITLEYWNQCLNDGGNICVRGIRVCQLHTTLKGRCLPGRFPA
jgi:hypothetical protein